MRFIDEVKIRVAGGHGGPGCISFRRETFEPRGGPDGGEGGAGGSVTFQASVQLGTLQDLRFKRTYRAKNGEPGSSANKAGRDGEDILIRVPVGTYIKDIETGETIIDLVEDKQSWRACKGGRGGKGNAHFVTSTYQAPRFAQPGEDGEDREVSLELKLLADVGIIGFPNAGKSTLISKISAARPKIADYAFTTLKPNLGVVSLSLDQSFVVADIPGLIEGAHRGLGLGHKFLKHIERTRVFVHLLDGVQLLEYATLPETLPPENLPATVADDSFSDSPSSSPRDSIAAAIDHLIHNYLAIRTELGLFNEKLLHKPEIVVINKMDIFGADPSLIERAKNLLRTRIHSIRGTHPLPNEPYIISAATGTGLEELKFALYHEIEAQKARTHDTSRNVQLPDSEGLRH